jgi:hypothetical protein
VCVRAHVPLPAATQPGARHPRSKERHAAYLVGGDVPAVARHHCEAVAAPCIRATALAASAAVAAAAVAAAAAAAAAGCARVLRRDRSDGSVDAGAGGEASEIHTLRRSRSCHVLGKACVCAGGWQLHCSFRSWGWQARAVNLSCMDMGQIKRYQREFL